MAKTNPTPATLPETSDAQPVTALALPAAPPPAVAQNGSTALDLPSLFALALEHGNVESLERLFALEERMNGRNAERAFYDDLAAAQGEFPPINKTRLVEGRYKYASLDDLMGQITPVLMRHRLSTSFERSFIQAEDGTIKAVSSALVIRHGDGHVHTCAPVVMPIERATSNTGKFMMTCAQSVGSAMTYADRYAYQGGLGFRPCDDDDDGRGGQAQPPRSNGNGGPQRASASPAQTAPVAAPAMPEGIKRTHPTDEPGWGLVHISTIKDWETKKGSPYIAIKIVEKPDAPGVSAFKTDHITMLRTAHDQQAPIWIRVVKGDNGYLNLEDVTWPEIKSDGRVPLDPSCDDPAAYPQREPGCDDPGPDAGDEPMTEDKIPF